MGRQRQTLNGYFSVNNEYIIFLFLTSAEKLIPENGASK